MRFTREPVRWTFALFLILVLLARAYRWALWGALVMLLGYGSAFWYALRLMRWEALARRAARRED
jgi:hypothetical protein